MQVLEKACWLEKCSQDLKTSNAARIINLPQYKYHHIIRSRFLFNFFLQILTWYLVINIKISIWKMVIFAFRPRKYPPKTKSFLKILYHPVVSFVRKIEVLSVPYYSIKVYFEIFCSLLKACRGVYRVLLVNVTIILHKTITYARLRVANCARKDLTAAIVHHKHMWAQIWYYRRYYYYYSCTSTYLYPRVY